MISYNDKDFSLLQSDFPNLFYDEKTNSVRGELDFNACYKNIGKKNKDKWNIFPCINNDDCLCGCYEIEIQLSRSSPIVFETSRKIEALAEKIDKSYNDLHLYGNNNQCCLGLGISQNITLSQFIINVVYPYFVWQAYFAKYKKIPPCGEYPHSKTVAIGEYYRDKNNLGRNDICLCGSGKKYKNCCIR